MKIYTVQQKDFLKNIDSEGFIIPPNPLHEIAQPILDEIEWAEHIRPAYEWMNAQYSKRTGLPLDRNLIWAFNTLEGFLVQFS